MRALLNLLLLAAMLRLPLLLTAGVPLFDEAFYVQSAKAMLSGAPDPVQDQPFFGRYIIAGSIAVLGDNRLGWRLPSLFAGCACVGLLYLICLRLGLGNKLSAFAAVLLALDPLHITFSRIAMLDIFALTFSLAGLYVLLSAGKNPGQWSLAGLLFGLAIASKWPAVFAVTGAICFVLLNDKKGLSFLKPVSGMLMIIAAVYLLTFLPLIISTGPQAFLDLHLGKMSSHLSMQGGAQISRPWEWLLGWQPIWLGWNDEPAFPFAAIALANPVTWWSGLVALLSVFIRLLQLMLARFRHMKTGIRLTTAETFCLVWFAATWVPWMLLPRGHTFLYYMLPVLPAYFIALASFVRRNPRKWAVPAIIAAAIAGLALFYPVVIGLSMPSGYFESLRWWIGWAPQV